MTAREDFSAVEMTASYDRGETWVYGVQLLDFRGDKIDPGTDLRRRGLGGPGVASQVAVRDSS